MAEETVAVPVAREKEGGGGTFCMGNGLGWNR